MNADCIDPKVRTPLIKAIFDNIKIRPLMQQPGVGDEEVSLILEFLDQAEDVLHDWSDNI